MGGVNPDATAALLVALRAGDARALDVLAEEWGPVVARWCARIGGPTVDEEDAAHDVMEVVLERVHTLRDPHAFAPWLYQTTRRVIRDHRRRAWIRRWVPGFSVETADPGEGAVHGLERSDRVRRVHAALDTLPAELREVLVLCEVEERNAAEVAALVGVPLGTVKSRLRRARERFAIGARARGLAPAEGG